MNNTIFRRKFIVGVLIALVLGFGAYGTADALTFGTTRTGDLQTLSPGQRFVVSFSVNLRSREAIQPRTSGPASQTLIDEAAGTTTPPASRTHTGYTAGDTYYWTTVSGTITTYNWVTESEAYRFNDQQVTIDPTGATIISIGNYNVDPANEADAITLNQMDEWSDGRKRLQSGTIRVTLEASDTPVAVTIAITDATVDADLPTDFNKSVFEMFRLYVLQLESASRAATISTNLIPSVVNDDQDTAISVTLTGAASDFARVGFEVYEGPGTLYEDKNSDNSPDSTAIKSITAFTSNHGTASQATVYLKTNGGTSKVRAWVFGNSPTTNVADKTSRATYIYRWSNLRKVSGDVTTQIGVISTQLEHPFIVELTDANGDAISGETITFAAATGAGTLAEDPNFPDDLYAADFSTSGNVETDANGRANVLLTLGAAAGANTVTATYDNATLTFNATGIARSDAASIEIVSGNNQSARTNQPLPALLVVIVRDRNGLVINDSQVRFSTFSGVLSTEVEDPGDVVDSPTPANSNQNQTIETDGTGRASVRYNVGNEAGSNRTITATLLQTWDNQTRRVVFTATHTGGTGPVTPQPGNNLSISLSRTTARIGDSVTATVDAGAGRSGVNVNLTSSSGLSLLFNTQTTGTNGRTAFTFTIPSGTASRNYTLRASATGYNAGTATLTVQGTQTNVVPSLSTSSISGARNTVHDVNVTLSGAPTGTRVDIGAPFNVFEPTNSSGVARFRLRLPASGSGNASVSATSYTSRVVQLGYTVTGSTPTTGTQVRLVLGSGASTQLTGAAGTNVQLRVRVTNTAGAGVNGVSVTFSSNNVDLATRTSDASGNVVVTYTVQTTAQTVTAVINDSNVDSSGASAVTFTITPGTAPTGPQSTRLNILQPNTVGAPGASHPLTILMATPTGAAAANQIVTITVRNSAQALISTTTVITGTDGRATTTDTFRLPTTAGEYTITATSGGETRTINVTVVAIKLVKDASDSVSGDNQEGDRGVVLDEPFAVRVVRDSDDTAMQGVPVTFTVIDGDGELSESSSATSGANTLTVNSDSNGDVEAYLVLGRDDEDNRVRASVGITTVPDVFFDATGALVPDALEIVSGDDQRIAVNQRSDPMRVLVTDEDGDELEGVTVTFSLRGGSGTLTPRSAETNRFGEAEAELLPRAAGTYTITARVVGVQSVTFTINVGDLADDIEIVSGNNQRGDTGTELANPFVVEVLDEDDDPVSGVTVTFSVTAGGGSLSDTSVDTNSRGRAQTTLTLGDSPGRNTVRASVSGVSTRVTFTATAVDPAPPEPVIHLGAGQRVDTYWINTDGGTLHRLVGSSVENIAPGVENVVSLVVTSNRLYWVETTSATTGRLRRSNLNGSNIQLIRDLTALPAGITVDTVNSKIYLTNGFGKVQSINLDGSGYAPNLITGLTDPTDIAVGGGKVYWITDGGTVHSANVDGTGVTQIAGGYSALGSIAVGGGKVFWTETINESDGNIHSANLDGSSVTEVVSLLAAPYGISVDASANKLYFTNSRGRLMQSNLNGGSIKIVASNLVAPGDVAVSSGTTAPRPPGTFSRYDVNRDGTVDNTDAALVANALGESPPSNPRLDVNGDGNVNFLDLLLVFDNRDESDAAPVAVASERPKVSREEVQHQIEQLLATDNHSATAQFTLAYLQSLLEIVTPEQTRLLANYPNPFNPETWIPYQLATSSDVQITIYNSAGKEVRTLSLGHQSEGYYTDRSRAAYWDGRNAIGEQVASGVYFYTLITDRMSATRKMLILK